VFPTYDLERQFRAIRLAGELTDVPVPKTWWCESDVGVLGTPFFVMSRVEGEPPPDVMPYNFGDSWLFEASAADQRRLVESTVDVIAALHAIDRPQERFDFLELDVPGDTALRRHVTHAREWYDWAAQGAMGCRLIEDAFTWLQDHWPNEAGTETVLCWGDSRIGNVLYRDFRPVAVLDWEMACLGPRQLDIAWLIYAHEIFEHLAASFGSPGMPDFMREADVVSAYEQRTGTVLGDLRFYRVYSAVQYAIVFLRTGARSVHFGEREMPEDAEDLLHNAEQLRDLIA
jgi:aminoglycoside phosphotransferase (APT) family kinase protein